MRRSVPARRVTGFALIEVLVTLVVLLFGLLGLAGVSARANLLEVESYQRIQALALLQDMVDRFNANRMAAPCYAGADPAAGLEVGTDYAGAPACTLATDIVGNPVSAGQQAQAVADILEWNTQLQGSAEINDGGSKIGAMVGAVGCVRQIDATNNIYLISVAWQGLADTVAPTDADDIICGEGTLNADKKHRMVTATVQIATLYTP